MQPLFIQVHPQDNVAIVVSAEGVAGGSQFENGLVVLETIPQAHKVALQDLEKGDAVVRYGQTIGTVNRSLRAGSWVREEVLDLPLAPPLDTLSLATATPKPLPALEGFTFEGYPSPDGMVGTKNILGITTTVQCVAPTVDHAVRRIEAEILPRFPGVDGVVAITHGYGCGVAIDAPDAAIPIRTLRNLSLHPNFGGAPLLVSLGCEKLQAERLLPGREFQWIGAEPTPAVGRQTVRTPPSKSRAARLWRHRRGDHALCGKATGGTRPAPAPHRASVSPGGWIAVWRQRCLLRSDLQPCGRIRRRFAGARRRHSVVFGGNRSS